MPRLAGNVQTVELALRFVDAAAGDPPLVLQRVAVGVGRFDDAEVGLVDAAVAGCCR